MRLALDLLWITVPHGIGGKLFQIEHLIGKVRLHQNIYVQIDVTENAAGERGWHVYIAVEQLRGPVALQESKDVVPAIEPIVFNRPSAQTNVAKQIMLHIVLECGITDN